MAIALDRNVSSRRLVYTHCTNLSTRFFHPSRCPTGAVALEGSSLLRSSSVLSGILPRFLYVLKAHARICATSQPFCSFSMSFHIMHSTHIVKRRSIVPHFKQENPVEQYPVYQSPLDNLRCLGPRRPRILQLHPPPICLLVMELVLRMQVLEVGRPFLASSVGIVGCGERCRDVVGGHFWLDAENCLDGCPNRGPAILNANLGR